MPDSAASVCTAEAEGARPSIRNPFFSASVRARFIILCLAGPGIALHADRAVLGAQDQPHRLFLSGSERTLAQMGVHHPAAHRRLAAAGAVPHQTDRLALLGHRLVRGEPVAALQCGRIEQAALALETFDRPFDCLDRCRAGAVGERGGEQVGLRKYRIALRQMRQAPSPPPRAPGSEFASAWANRGPSSAMSFPFGPGWCTASRPISGPSRPCSIAASVSALPGSRSGTGTSKPRSAACFGPGFVGARPCRRRVCGHASSAPRAGRNAGFAPCYRSPGLPSPPRFRPGASRTPL